MTNGYRFTYRNQKQFSTAGASAEVQIVQAVQTCRIDAKGGEFSKPRLTERAAIKFRNNSRQAREGRKGCDYGLTHRRARGYSCRVRRG
jgi:hypothetical protein